MATRELNTAKMNAENVNALTRKAVPTRRGALGEIGNKVNLPGAAPATKKSSLKTKVPAKAVVRHASVVPSKAIAKPRPVLRAASTVVLPKVSAAATSKKPLLLVKTNNATKVVTLPAEAKTALATQETALATHETALATQETALATQVLPPDLLDDEEDPLLVAIYITDIFQYLKYLEDQYKVRPDHLSGQDITSRMRSILIDWLADVHQQFKLLPESLYLTAAIIDRFLQDYRTIERKKLQLVGVSAMSIACKYEEQFAPDVGDFVYITDNAYTKKQILEMEGCILQTLKFNFGRPVPLQFLRRFSKVSHASPEVHFLSKYFLELSLLDYSMCHLAPSIVAAAASFLSMWLLNEYKPSVWNSTMVKCSTYTLDDMALVVRRLAVVVVKSPTSSQQAIRKKYASAKNHSISCRPELQSEELKKLASGQDE